MLKPSGQIIAMPNNNLCNKLKQQCMGIPFQPTNLPPHAQRTPKMQLPAPEDICGDMPLQFAYHLPGWHSKTLPTHKQHDKLCPFQQANYHICRSGPENENQGRGHLSINYMPLTMEKKPFRKAILVLAFRQHPAT
jgi:hypothetical protein